MGGSNRDNGGSFRDLQRQTSEAKNVGDQRTPRSRSKGRYLKGTNIKKPPSPDAEGMLAIILQPLNLLLFFLPAGIAADRYEWGDIYVFWLNFFSMVPLAKVLG